ncbi:MAG: membrane protein insertase YidC [bacterium]
MQKNLVLALLLSAGVYIGWYSWIEKQYGSSRRQQPSVPQSANIQTAPAPLSFSGDPSGTAPGTAQTPEFSVTADALPPAPGWQSRAIEFKLPHADVLMHPDGAGIISFRYHGPMGPVELVPNLRPGFFSSFPGVFFEIAKKDRESVTFTGSLPSGLNVQKKFTWSPEGGLNSLEITLSNPLSRTVSPVPWTLLLGPGLGTVKNEEKENVKLWKAVYAVQEEGRKHPSLKSLPKSPASGGWLWAGLDNRYFLAAALPETWETGTLAFFETPVKDGKAPGLSIPGQQSPLNPKETRTAKISFYLGPKDYALLTSLGRGLNRSVDFGFFSPLAKLANSALGRLYNLTGNYGVAILILTVIMQVFLFPLTWKSFKATLIMKKLQPQMQMIQQKYKGDPKRLNVEMMGLYKKHGANPLGGCLPMLLQMPIFFALFTTLRNSWNLHGAHFIFWIRDLSSKDPYYVLPITMGAVMFLQQHLTPQTADPAQASIMKWMPVIFTFMFVSFPAGLVLYWLTNSIFGFIQQLYMQKKMT